MFFNTSGKKAVFFLAAAAVMCLTGCSGKEEPKLEIRSEDVSLDYEFAIADYDDVVLMQKISCIYSQVSEEELSFSTDKRELTHIYVSDGESVKAGQLVAMLNIDDIEKKKRDNIDLIEQDELLATETEKLVSYYENLLAGNLNLTRREEIMLKMSERKQEVDKYRIEIEELTEENLSFEKTIEDSKLYAGMDGMVSNINKALLNTRPTKGSVVMKIISNDHCSFISRDKEALMLLKAGDPVNIVISEEKTIAGTVYMVDRDNERVIIDMDEPDYTLKMSTRGIISVELERVENVLSLPVDAVHISDDLCYVYVLSENGVRELKEIEPGLFGTERVEIKSGLEPYDQVILRKD